jgi:hypothetical protein
VIEIISRLPDAMHAHHDLTVWQTGQRLRQLSATLGARPPDRLIVDGVPQPWEGDRSFDAAVPTDALNRRVMFAMLSNLGLDLADVLGHRRFDRTAVLAPMLTSRPEDAPVEYAEHRGITDVARMLGFGVDIDSQELGGDLAAEADYRRDLQAIMSDFQRRVAAMTDLHALAAATVAVSRTLKALGWRADPAVMHATEAALAQALRLDAAHAATDLLRRLFEDARRQAFAG